MAAGCRTGASSIRGEGVSMLTECKRRHWSWVEDYIGMKWSVFVTSMVRSRTNLLILHTFTCGHIIIVCMSPTAICAIHSLALCHLAPKGAASHMCSASGWPT